MNVRTVTAATAALATAALLLPALQAGAAAEPPSQSKRPGCSVTVDPKGSRGFAGGAVLREATLGYDPVNHPLSGGYYVDEEEYPQSSTFRATVAYQPPSTGGCGTITVVTFPYVKVDTAAAMLPDAVQATTAVLSGTGTSITIDSLVVGLPADSLRNDLGLCVGSALEVRDDNGNLVQRLPETGALDFCPVGPGKTYAG